MLNLPSYRSFDVFHRGAASVVYRSTRDADSLPVIIKITAKEYPSLREVSKLKQEYEVASKLRIPGIVRCHALEKHGNGLALVMNDIGATSLDKLTGGRPMPLDAFLDVALKITEVLVEVHKAGIVHKDIKPAHVIMNRASGAVNIIDFGIASLLSIEQHRTLTSRHIEGTLTHVSPEQTGRVNRTVDQRSDLYSLGVTFFELLTGRLPFSSDDPLEMIHWHLAVTPESPSRLNADVPQALSNIVLKLLAKTPEERYGSAAGLKSDLDRCRESIERGEPFELSTAWQLDWRGSFQLPQKLYGREAEVEALLSTFHRTCDGPAELLLVSGYSGIGKSSLVHELQKSIVARRGNYVAGKFDQYKRNVPYASFVQAFQALVQQVLAEDQARVAEWRRRLLFALGSSARLLIHLVPELSLLVGNHPPPPKLSGADAQRRFNEAFLSFVRVFTKPEHPLVVFLDDLQWADAGTFSLIHFMMTSAELNHLLLIGAYRDNEVSPHHPMHVMLDELRSAGARVSQVELKPFASGSLEALVADAMRSTPEAVRPLADVIMAKTHGNPFFVGQLLQSLHQEGHISFDEAAGQWRWDLQSINSKDITENVVDLMTKRIQRLDPDTQAALQMGSCIGSTFDLKTLSVVHGKSLKATADELWRALEESLVIPLSESYKIPRIYDLDAIDDASLRGMAEATRYKFLHDRVQQAAYSMIAPELVKSTHLRIGRLWLSSASEAELADSLFEVVAHFNTAIELITDPAELYRVIELDIEAGRKAKGSSAFEACQQLLATAMKHLPESAWTERYDLALACYVETGEAALLTGRYAEALKVLDEAERHTEDVLDRCRVCELKVVACKMRADLDAAFDSAAELLASLGIHVPRSPTDAQLYQELAATNAVIGERSIDDLVQQPEMTDPIRIAVCRVLQELWPVAFFLASLGMHIAAMKIVQISARHGNTTASVFGYMVYAFARVEFFKDIEEGYRLGLVSLRLHERLQSRELEAKILDMWGGIIQLYKEPLRDCRDTLWRGFALGMEAGDYQWSGYCIVNYCRLCIFDDVPLGECIARIEEFLPVLSRYDRDMTISLQIKREALASLTGDKPDPMSLTGAFCNEEEVVRHGRDNNNFHTLCVFNCYKLFLAVWFGANDQILAPLLEAERTIGAATGVWLNPLFYFFQSVGLLSLCDTAEAGERAAYIHKARAGLAILEQRRAHAPQNVGHMVSLIEAELARVEDQIDDAMRSYDDAIATAREHGLAWLQALASERAFHFYRLRRSRAIASAYLKDARHAYLLWGAKAKVRQIDALFPELLADQRSQSDSMQDDIDLLAVVRASQAFSSELVLSRLIEALMRLAIEAAGAQTGFLILTREDARLYIESSWPKRDSLSLPISVEQSDFVPKQIIRYSAHTMTPVIVDNASTADTKFRSDPYIIARDPKSLLCVPIIRQRQLTGLLYLENNVITHAFTAEKVKVVSVLAVQAAISLENARLYDEMEQRVAQRTRELYDTQQKLVETAHRAGMAEIATNVLHNVGNILNSVNVSATMLINIVQQSAPDKLTKVAELLTTNVYQPGDFLASDKGKMLAAYLMKLAEIQKSERETLLAEVRHLRTNIDDIRGLLVLQQSHATGAALVEELDLAELIDNALKIVLAAAPAEDLVVKREFAPVPRLCTERYKVQHVLINIISNAVHALNAAAVEPKVLTVRLFRTEDAAFCVEVLDNGIGIPAENITRIFQHGFTTRKGGHGFGLHASANAARELSGQLMAFSDGPGSGARFRFELPDRRAT